MAERDFTVEPKQNEIAWVQDVYLANEDYFQVGAHFPINLNQELTNRLEKRRKLYDYGRLRDSDEVPVEVNWYRRVTNFWAETLSSQPPSIETDRKEVDDFITEFRELIFDIAVLVAKGASIEGVGVYASIREGQLGYVNARNWVPVVDPANDQEIVKHFLVYPYVSGEATSDNTTCLLYTSDAADE